MRVCVRVFMCVCVDTDGVSINIYWTQIVYYETYLFIYL